MFLKNELLQKENELLQVRFAANMSVIMGKSNTKRGVKEYVCIKEAKVHLA